MTKPIFNSNTSDYSNLETTPLRLEHFDKALKVLKSAKYVPLEPERKIMPPPMYAGQTIVDLVDMSRYIAVGHDEYLLWEYDFTFDVGEYLKSMRSDSQ